MADNSSKGARDMRLADEMHDGIVRLAGERGWHETREAWLARAARKAGITCRRAKTFFYREPGAYRAADVEAVRAALAKQHKPPTRVGGTNDTPSALASRLAAFRYRQARLAAELDDLEREAVELDRFLGVARSRVGAARGE